MQVFSRNSLFLLSRGRVLTTHVVLVAALVGCTGSDSADEPAAGTVNAPAEAVARVDAPALDAGAGANPSEAQAGAAAAPQAPPAALVEWPGPGKYGCSESISRMVNGSFEYTPEGRGYLTIDGRGGYVDPYGVQGSYTTVASQESRFSGGALDDAVVTPLEGDEPRLWVVIPTESGERRWSCTFTDE